MSIYLTNEEVKKIYEHYTTSRLSLSRLADDYHVSLSTIKKSIRGYENDNKLEPYRRKARSNALTEWNKRPREQKKQIDKPANTQLIDYSKCINKEESESDEEDKYIEIDNKKIMLVGDQLIESNMKILNKIKQLTDKEDMTDDDILNLENLLIQVGNKNLLGDKFIKQLQDKYINNSSSESETDPSESLHLLCSVCPEKELIPFLEQDHDSIYSYILNQISNINKGGKSDDKTKIKFYIGIRNLLTNGYINKDDRVIKYLKDQLKDDYTEFIKRYKLKD